MSVFAKDLKWIEEHFCEIQESSEVFLDLKYASEDNFMAKNVYQDFQRCFLAAFAFERFEKACFDLKQNHPGLQFVIWDTLRPRSVQSLFFAHLKGTPFQDYVAAPYPGSLHNFGMAMDLTLRKKDGAYLDMGTGFDDFQDLAQPRLESQFLASGELTAKQYQNRMLLRGLMEKQGFKVLDHEWWHFNALPKEQVYDQFPVLE